MARLQSRPSEKEIAEVERFLMSQLKKESYREIIRCQALKALAEIPGVGDGMRPTVLDTLLDWASAGKPKDARVHAVLALGKIAKTASHSVRATIFKLFDSLADEDSMRLRMALVQAIHAAEHPSGAPLLEKIQQVELDGRVRRDALLAVDSLRSAGSMPESVGALKTALARLEEDHRKLRSQLEELGSARRKR
jgi:HEAT repeat protein